MKWVIAYDVSSDRDRRLIAKRLEQVGFRRQKSVFEGEASHQEIKRLLDELVELADAQCDVLTAWPTVENPPVHIEHRGAPRNPTRRDWMIV